MTRRLISVIMIIMLLCSCMAVTSYAAVTENSSVKDKIPEAVVLVQVDNAECRMIEKMTDLTVDIKLKDGRDVINVPVERVEAEEGDMVALWLGYSYDEIDAQVKADMAEFQKDYHLGNAEDFLINALSLLLGFEDMSKDLLAIFQNYEIVINGIPEDADHEFEIETNTMLITSTLVSELFDIATELIASLMELDKEAAAEIDSFSDMVELVNDMLVEYELIEKGKDIYDFIIEMAETDEITKEDLVAAVEEMDAVLEYMQSEEYTGTVFAGVYMYCECPYTVEYTIYHQYFKEVDGKMTLAGTANFGTEDYVDQLLEMLGNDAYDFYEYDYERYYYKGLSGDVIKASDIINTEFNNEQYTYVGSYDAGTLILPDEDDPYYYTDSYDFATLDELYNCEDWWTEYKYDQIILGNEDWDAPSGLVLRYELLEEGDSTPATGDDSNMTPFYVVMMIALAVMAAAVITRRRQTN